MHGKVKRTNEYTSELLKFIQREYGVKAVYITSAKRGFYGETWQIDTADDNKKIKRYFLKMVYAPAHKPFYERSFRTIQYLFDHGITQISRIVKTLTGRLYTCYDTAVVGLFEWIDGKNIQNERTKIAEYEILATVYSVKCDDINIPRDEFSAKSAETFYLQWSKLDSDSGNKHALRISSILKQHHQILEQRAKRLSLFARRSNGEHLYITHGDAGGNVIVQNNDFYLVDWDDARIAPPERDAWFCMNRDWAVNAFNHALKEHGICYSLRAERLAYYCYHSFFYYLTEYLQTFFELQCDMADDINEFFGCWINEQIEYADTLK